MCCNLVALACATFRNQVAEFRLLDQVSEFIFDAGFRSQISEFMRQIVRFQNYGFLCGCALVQTCTARFCCVACAPKAQLVDVIIYLRGNRHLAIPDSWYDTVNAAVRKLCP